MIRFQKWLAILEVLILGLAALIAFVPTQRWWTPATLLCLCGGIYLYKRYKAKDDKAKTFGHRYDDDGEAFVLFLIGTIAVSFLWGLLQNAEWGIILTVPISVAAFFVGYAFAEFNDE
jgi:membrane protein implicated in regulation of membrane protease activity